MFQLFNSFAVEKFDIESNKNFHNAIFANGIFQMRKAPIGTFIVPVEKKDFSNLGLTQMCESSFVPNYDDIPKIPCGILEQVIILYRAISKTISSEVYCAIVWDRVNKDFFIHVPDQEVSAATINYVNTPEIYNNPDLAVVMDIHSHVNMNAFFSGTDLADEMGTRFFGVIGKIDQPHPEMVVRAATNGEEIKLKVADVFDFQNQKLTEASNYTVPTEHYEKIKEFVPAYKKPGTVVGSYAGWYDEDYYAYPNYTNKARAVTTTTKPVNTDPYVKLYNLIGTIRYGKKYSFDAATNFLTVALECVGRYVEDLNVDEIDIHHLMEQTELVSAFRFNSAIEKLHGIDHADVEVEFTPSLLGSENDNSDINP